MTEQAKFIYSPLEKAFEKPTKTSEGQGKNKRCYYESKQKISGFGFNKYDDHKVNYKEMFEELVKERFDEIKN